MTTRVAGYILRAKDRYATASFYADLGLETIEHQHGGPKHYEVGPLANESVVEVYTQSDAFPHDALMLYVDSIALALEVASKYAIEPISDMKSNSDSTFVYIKDPDGRPLMLIEMK